MVKRSSRRRFGIGASAVLFLLTAGLAVHSAQQSDFPGIAMTRGQDVSPTFDGWERNPDGTFSMYFGYFNRNSEEEIVVPVGPENTFDLGNGDQGQPTYFYTGRRWFAFKVVVPANWPKDKRLIWTLTNRGRTNQSKGWLQPEWEVDKLLIAKDGGRDPFLGVSGSPESAAAINAGNLTPVIMGGPAQTITLPAAATLKVTVTDDGIPKPFGSGRSRVEGVQIQWILFRGPAKVRFDPELSPAVHGKPLTTETEVSFSVPGDYQIRAIANDGVSFSTYDVNVKVSPSKP